MTRFTGSMIAGKALEKKYYTLSGLSFQSRIQGGVKGFYTHTQVSLLVSMEIPKDLPFRGP